MATTWHFLLVFDGAIGTVRGEVRRFGDVAAALRAYREAEREHEGDPSVQVVLIAADSLETVRATHPNYWGDADLRRLIEPALP